MKISELEKGMLLTPVGDSECFTIYGTENKWLNVVPKGNSQRYGWYNLTKSKIAVYLGTKKDVCMDVKWTDKFVLIDNEIVGVDPSAWRKIKKIVQGN